MKKIITLYTVLVNLLAYCQEGVILPLNYSSDLDILNGTYVKDIDNEFEPYIGTWQGTYGKALDAKTFTLKIEKITHKTMNYPNGDYYYRDVLIGKYTVVEASTGLVIVNTMTTNDPDMAKITSYFAPHANYFKFSYSDKDFCSISANIDLFRNMTNPNILIYYYNHESFWMPENCPYVEIYNVPIPIPSVSLTLTKIN